LNLTITESKSAALDRTKLHLFAKNERVSFCCRNGCTSRDRTCDQSLNRRPLTTTELPCNIPQVGQIAVLERERVLSVFLPGTSTNILMLVLDSMLDVQFLLIEKLELFRIELKFIECKSIVLPLNDSPLLECFGLIEVKLISDIFMLLDD
jgi:hypothetical protein